MAPSPIPLADLGLYLRFDGRMLFRHGQANRSLSCSLNRSLQAASCHARGRNALNWQHEYGETQQETGATKFHREGRKVLGDTRGRGAVALYGQYPRQNDDGKMTFVQCSPNRAQARLVSGF